MNYEKDLEIDKLSLDEEWLQQASKFMRYAEKSAKADANLKKEKENLKIVFAEQFAKAKNSAEKVTDKTAENISLSSKEHRKAVDGLTDAIEEAGVMDGAVKAFEQRKNALENLVKLYLNGYWSEPREERSDKPSIKDTAMENAQQKQTQKLNDKRRKK